MASIPATDSSGSRPAAKAASVTLQVLAITPVARDTVTLALVLPGTTRAPGQYLPGQFITLAFPGKGTVYYRSYSLCGDGRSEYPWEITVKRHNAGIVSSYIYAHVRPGMVLQASMPEGRFTLPLVTHANQLLVFVAAGTGITPIFSMLRALSLRPGEERPRVLLHYGYHSPTDAIYGAELAALDPERLWLTQWHYVATSGHRLGVDQVLSSLGSDAGVAEWYICGPASLKRNLESALPRHGVPPSHIHTEAFASPASQVSAIPGAPTVGHIRLADSAAVLDSRAGETVLQTLERSAIALISIVVPARAERAGCACFPGGYRMAAETALLQQSEPQVTSLAAWRYRRATSPSWALDVQLPDTRNRGHSPCRSPQHREKEIADWAGRGNHRAISHRVGLHQPFSKQPGGRLLIEFFIEYDVAIQSKLLSFGERRFRRAGTIESGWGLWAAEPELSQHQHRSLLNDAGAENNHRALVQRSGRPMATDVSVQISATEEKLPDAERAADNCMRWFEEVDLRLSRFRSESELSHLNRSAGRWFAASPLLYAATAVALHSAHASSGRFDPTLLCEIEALGYDRDFALIAERETVESQTREPTARPPFVPGKWRGIELDPVGRRIRLPKDGRLDLGGIAKGWAADVAFHRFGLEFGGVLINLGGDLRAHGGPQEGENWSVGIRDPRFERVKPKALPHGYAAILGLSRGGLATSGALRRWWLQNGKRQHHLLNPETGLPMELWIDAEATPLTLLTTGRSLPRQPLWLRPPRGRKWRPRWHCYAAIHWLSGRWRRHGSVRFLWAAACR